MSNLSQLVPQFAALPPVSGRLCLRTTTEGAIACGVLYLPGELQVIEGAAYSMLIAGGRILLSPSRLDDGALVDAGNVTLQCMARTQEWFKAARPGGFTARFVHAFPDQNGWAFVALSDSPEGAPHTASDTGDRWFDIAYGRVAAIAAPSSTCGMQPGQVVANLTVWPGPDGALHRLSQVASSWRPDFLRHSQLLARVGSGELSPAQARQAISADPRLRVIGAGSLDLIYCRYLAELSRLAPLPMDAPRSSAEQAAHDLHVEQACRTVRNAA